MNSKSSMPPQRYTRKYSFGLILISWLFLRLRLGVELSRLAILRIKPMAQVSRITQDQKAFPRCLWVLVQDRFYSIGIDSIENALVIQETVIRPD